MTSGHVWCSAAADTTITAGSQGFVAANHEWFKEGSQQKPTNLLFEPNFKQESESFMAKSCYSAVSDNSGIYINVMNAGNENISIKKGTILGEITEVELAEQKFEESVLDFVPLDLKQLKQDAKQRRLDMNLNGNGKWSSLRGKNTDQFITTRDIAEHEYYLKLKTMKFGDLLNQAEKDQMLETLIKSASIFQFDKSQLTHTDLTVHSIPTGDNLPIQQKQYPIPSIARESLVKQVQEMLDAKVIRPSTSSWRSPILLVKKKSLDGTIQYRFCIDLKKVNAITAKDCYALPLIGQTVDALIGCAYFSTLDLDRAFWQVPVSEKDKCKLAFVIDGKLFEFNVMPFGSMNAPATFQRLVDRVLRGLTWKQCLIYIDDVLIFSKEYDHHLQDVHEVLSRFKHAGLKLKPEKCAFAVENCEYLGFKISKDGIQVTARKIEAVLKIDPPSTVKGLYSFLCSMNYYRSLIPRFGDLTADLYKMTETKRRLCDWNESSIEKFNKLKQSLVSAPILAFPDSALPFVIQSDASGHSIASVLLQKHGEIYRPVAFASRKLNQTERRYSTTERELLSVVYAVKQFYLHVEGRHLTIYTDHEPIVTMKSLKNPMGRLGRLFHELSDVSYNLVHIKGKDNHLPDFLSRANVVDSREANINLTELMFTINWQSEQDKDPNIVQVKTLLDKNEAEWPASIIGKRWLRERKKLYVFNGILYNENRIVVPSHLVQEIMKQHHDSVFAGHRGVETTVNSIKTRYYWNFMPTDVETYCKSCHKCQIFNYSQSTNRAPLHPIIVSRPWQIVGLDYMGPFKATQRGNIYIIIGICHFTKFVLGAATTTFSAEVTAEFLFKEVVCKFGMIQQILSDQGSNFESLTFKHLCNLIGANKTHTTTYHAPGNGITERVNKNVKPYLAKFVNSNHDDWDLFMPMVISAYNNSYHSTIGMTPYEAQFGRPSIQVSDVIMNNQLPIGTKVSDIAEFTLALRRAAARINILLEENTRIAQIKQKESYDRFINNKLQFKVGDTVKINNFHKPVGSVAAFVPKFIGPYTITSFDGELVYTLESPVLRTEKVHYNRLSRYCMRDKTELLIPNESIYTVTQKTTVSNQAIIPGVEIDLEILLEDIKAKKQKAIEKKRLLALKAAEETIVLEQNRLLRLRQREQLQQQHMNEIIDQVINGGELVLDDFIRRNIGTLAANDRFNDEFQVNVNNQIAIYNPPMQFVPVVEANGLEANGLEANDLEANGLEANGLVANRVALETVQTEPAHYNDKNKICDRCLNCGEWKERKTGMRIHLLTCLTKTPSFP